MKKLSLTAKVGTGLAALALTAVWVAERAWAFNPQPDPPGISGIVGVVDGQTARLNVVNVSPATLGAELFIRAGDGSVRNYSRVSLRPGQAASLDAVPTAADTRGDGRLGVYGEVVLLPAVRQVIPPDPYRPSLEVFNANGRTTVLDTNFHNPPADHNPPGD